MGETRFMTTSRRFNNVNDAWACPAVVWAALTLAGCGKAGTDGSGTLATPPPATAGEGDHDHDAHAHPSEGPHHGDLIELGNEEFHAEIVHGEGGAVTVYVLDSAAKAAVPVEATEILLNVSHDGKPEQFRLTATPDASDPSGKSSKFNVVNADLAKHLDDEHTTAKLVITIAGKQFTGKVEHKHDDEHGHEHK